MNAIATKPAQFSQREFVPVIKEKLWVRFGNSAQDFIEPFSFFGDIAIFAVSKPNDGDLLFFGFITKLFDGIGENFITEFVVASSNDDDITKFASRIFKSF